MRKYGVWLCLVVSLFLLSATTTNAADRTASVSTATTRVEKGNSQLKVFPYTKISEENSRSYFMSVTTYFNTADGRPSYEKMGDTVSFFLQPNSSEAIGWVDLNADNEYDSGEELSTHSYVESKGYFIKDAKLSRIGAVNLYLGSKSAGSFDAGIYLATNGARGALLDHCYYTAESSDSLINLSVYNSTGQNTLSGNDGTVTDPYSIEPGQAVILKARVTLDNDSSEDKNVVFYKEQEGAPSVEIGNSSTDEDGYAQIRVREDKRGVYSYYATTEGNSSKMICIYFNPVEGYDIKSITPDNTILAINQNYELKFSIVDRYGNEAVEDQESITVEFEGAPSGSIYKGDHGFVRGNNEGLVTIPFKPDRIGEYHIKCTYDSRDRSDYLRIIVLPFGTPVSMNIALKANVQAIPSVCYIDSNQDNVPEAAGYLEVKLRDDKGAEYIANGSAQYRVTFECDSQAVEVTNKGDIIVKDKNFIGSIPIKVTNQANNLSKIYNVLVAGNPVSIKPTISVQGKRAEVAIQYLDSQGNSTCFQDGEEYEISSPQGAGAFYKKNFNQAGQASFVVLAEEKKTYSFTVKTKQSKLEKTFTVAYGISSSTKTEQIASKIVMFIGSPLYTHNGVGKISEVAPFIKDSRTFVAIRPVAEAFAADIQWDDVRQAVTLTKGNFKIKLVIGSDRIEKSINGVNQYIDIDVPAFIKDGRTVLPFRAVGEAFGAQVEYESATNSVSYSM